MPIDYSQYPKDWKAIRGAILARAQNRCEWCGAENAQRGAHHPELGWKPDQWWIDTTCNTYGVEASAEDLPSFWPKTFCRVVLTIAHLGTPKPDGTPGDKQDTHDCRPENLAALCQRCHLRFDLADHCHNARQNRRAKQLARQPELLIFDGSKYQCL